MEGILCRKVLAPWHPLLRECQYAYTQMKYLIVVPSLLLVLEGLVATAGGTLPARDKPQKVTRRLYEQNQMFRATLWASVDSFIGRIFQPRSFADEPPAIINRHWILHGRDSRQWTQADCLRLFQAIDTLSFIAEKNILPKVDVKEPDGVSAG